MNQSVGVIFVLKKKVLNRLNLISIYSLKWSGHKYVLDIRSNINYEISENMRRLFLLELEVWIFNFL